MLMQSVNGNDKLALWEYNYFYDNFMFYKLKISRF